MLLFTPAKEIKLVRPLNTDAHFSDVVSDRANLETKRRCLKWYRIARWVHPSILSIKRWLMLGSLSFPFFNYLKSISNSRQNHCSDYKEKSLFRKLIETVCYSLHNSMKSSASTFKTIKKSIFLIKIYVSYFLVKTVSKIMFIKVLCYEHVFMEMIFLCVLIWKACVIKYHPILISNISLLFC